MMYLINLNVMYRTKENWLLRGHSRLFSVKFVAGAFVRQNPYLLNSLTNLQNSFLCIKSCMLATYILVFSHIRSSWPAFWAGIWIFKFFKFLWLGKNRPAPLFFNQIWWKLEDIFLTYVSTCIKRNFKDWLIGSQVIDTYVQPH